MIRKSRIKYLLIKELSKVILYSLITFIIVYLLQIRHEKIANQFDLNEETQTYYKKNFSHFKTSLINSICPLYPSELGKRTKEKNIYVAQNQIFLKI